jgi:hypothetical protein
VTETRRPARSAPLWDPPITVGLLLWGLITTVQTVAQARDLPAALDAAFSARGVGPYTQTGVATAIGWVVVVESVLSLVVAIGFSVPRIRDHRIAFWVPLLAGAVSSVVTVLLITAAILADPAYVAALTRMGGVSP